MCWNEPWRCPVPPSPERTSSCTNIPPAPLPHSPAAASGSGGLASPWLGDRLEALERATIEEALQAHRFNKTATARALGLTLRALRYRMEKLGLP